MYWSYGSYDHPTGEVNLTHYTKRGVYSNRDRLMYKVVRMTGVGLICAGSEAAVQARVEEIYDAYRYNYRSGGLRHTDGTPTEHFLNNNDTMGGVKVIDLAFPESQPGEYATYRTFRVILEGTYPAIHDQFDQILWYGETIESIGVGGLKWLYVKPRLNSPIIQPLVWNDTQTIVQSGSSLGFDAWVGDLGPIFSSYERSELRRSAWTTPRRIWRQSSATEFRHTWTYVFEVPFAIFPPPTPPWK